MSFKNSINIILSKILGFKLRLLLSLRYKVVINGIDVLKKNRPAFILPSHQAIIDPVILLSYIYKYSTAIPVITSDYYEKPILKTLFSNWGAVNVSNLEAGSRNTQVLNEITEAVTKAFENNKNVILYPSGQLAGQGFEKIFNKKSAHAVVSEMPSNVIIIGVRITGLWGSMWSKAWVGRTPDFSNQFLKGIFYTLVNFIFLIPRRRVIIDFEDITSQAKEQSKISRQSFNSFLEVFYNKNGEEEPSYIKHYFFGRKPKRSLPDKITGSLQDVVQTVLPTYEMDIPENILEKIKKITAEVLKYDFGQIRLESNIKVDLGADSLSMVELISEIENQFDTYHPVEINDIKTIGDLCLSAMGIFSSESDLKPSYLINHLTSINNIQVNNQINILWQMIDMLQTNNDDYFLYDSLLGSTNRKTFLLKASVVAQIIKQKTKQKHIGIMLPALQSTTLLIAATYIAGKVPVMLNWTVGSKVLEHCIETAKIDAILSADSFVKKIEDQLPKSIQNLLVLLEKEIPKIDIYKKLKGLIVSMFPKLFSHQIKLTDTAVVLFTSGSEALPKAVPLSHKNLLSDLNSVFNMIELSNDLIFLSFLPPFHSFGFTILSILPLVTGVKVAYTPNPTDAREVLKILKHTKANVLLGTPGFLKLLLNVGSEYFFKSVKLLVSGAEAMPENLKILFEDQTRNAKLIEGYGITECSPVLTLNPIEKQKLNSVGKFLPCVKSKIIDLDTGNICGVDEPGMIYVQGENVFNGYLGTDMKSPFEVIDGEKWYKTGDLGYLDNDGYLFITGRLKRFVKIAGEMISLPFIEKILLKYYGSDEEPVLAVEGSDKITPTQIVLFSVYNIDLSKANKLLIENCVAPIAKIHKMLKVPHIPVLGTGKTDYKVLRDMIESGD